MDGLLDFVPTVGAVLGVVAVLALAHWLMEKLQGVRAGRRFQSAIVMLGLTLLGFVVIILSLPIGDARQGQLLSLFGIVLSAAVGLSATNFLGNTLAGFMLRGVRPFRIGDFIRCGEHFGRVTEQGLVHTEIQIEIVSPTFMNQRVFDPKSAFIPDAARAVTEPAEAGIPEQVVFDKADEAESLEKLRATLGEVKGQIAELKAERKKAEDDAARGDLDRRVERLGRRQEALEQHIKSREERDEATS